MQGICTYMSYIYNYMKYLLDTLSFLSTALAILFCRVTSGSYAETQKATAIRKAYHVRECIVHTYLPAKK